jgi:predicted lipase
MTDPAAFDKALALLGIKAADAAYEIEDVDRRDLLTKAGLSELGYIQARSDARALIVEHPVYGIGHCIQGTQFTALEIPIILENLRCDAVAVGAGRVHAGYWDQVQALLPGLAQAPSPAFIVGHSLGGSAASLYANTGAFPVTTRLLTYGAPRCADAAFWQSAKIWPTRFTNERDPAPVWPFCEKIYTQPGLEWWLHRGEAAVECAAIAARPTWNDWWPDHFSTEYIAQLEHFAGLGLASAPMPA